MAKQTYQKSQTYYCRKCRKKHNSGSKIGIKHLIEIKHRKLTEEERIRMFKAKKEGIY